MASIGADSLIAPDYPSYAGISEFIQGLAAEHLFPLTYLAPLFHSSFTHLRGDSGKVLSSLVNCLVESAAMRRLIGFFARLVIRSFNGRLLGFHSSRSLVYSFTRSLVQSFIRSIVQSFTCHSFTRHSFTRLLFSLSVATRSLIHSFSRLLFSLSVFTRHAFTRRLYDLSVFTLSVI